MLRKDSWGSQKFILYKTVAVCSLLGGTHLKVLDLFLLICVGCYFQIFRSILKASLGR